MGTPGNRVWLWAVLGVAFAALALARIITVRGPLGSVVGEVGMVCLSAAQIVNEQRQKRGFRSADIRHLPARGTYLAEAYLALMILAVVGVFGGGLLFVLEVGHVIGR